MSVFGRCLMGALFVAALSLGVWITVTAQGLGEIKLNCQNTPCDAVARGRAAFNDRNPHGLGGNGRACADCHVPSESFQLSPAVARARFEALLARSVRSTRMLTILSSGPSMPTIFVSTATRRTTIQIWSRTASCG